MGELILALMLVILSILIYTQTGDLPSMNESQLDPGSFPQLIAILLGLLSLFLVIQKSIQLLKERQDQKSIKETLRNIYVEHRLVLVTLALLLLYILAIQIIGFIISTIIFMVVTALIIGPRTKKDIITISSIALILTVSLYVFFQNVLQVRFPTGLFF